NLSIPGGECRHKAICIQHYGVGLECTGGCTPSCGAASTLKATVTAPAGATSFDYTLTKNGSQVQQFLGVAATTKTFTVSVSGPNENYTVEVKAHGGASFALENCIRVSNTVPLSATSL